jgi:hypothetical protein
LFLPPRIRGYHSDQLKLPGFATGAIESYYYALPESKLKMQEYWPVSLGSSSWVFSHTADTLLFLLCDSFPTGVGSFLRSRITRELAEH